MAKKGDFLDYPKNKWILHHCQEFLHIFLNSFPEPWKKVPHTAAWCQGLKRSQLSVTNHDCQNKFTENWHCEPKWRNLKWAPKPWKSQGSFLTDPYQLPLMMDEGFGTSTRNPKSQLSSFLPFSDHRIEESTPSAKKTHCIMRVFCPFTQISAQ